MKLLFDDDTIKISTEEINILNSALIKTHTDNKLQGIDLTSYSVSSYLNMIRLLKGEDTSYDIMNIVGLSGYLQLSNKNIDKILNIYEECNIKLLPDIFIRRREYISYKRGVYYYNTKYFPLNTGEEHIYKNLLPINEYNIVKTNNFVHSGYNYDRNNILGDLLNNNIKKMVNIYNLNSSMNEEYLQKIWLKFSALLVILINNVFNMNKIFTKVYKITHIMSNADLLNYNDVLSYYNMISKTYNKNRICITYTPYTNFIIDLFYENVNVMNIQLSYIKK